MLFVSILNWRYAQKNNLKYMKIAEKNPNVDTRYKKCYIKCTGKYFRKIFYLEM